jgi:proteasome lid subunit RPN8/RPN11
MMPDPVLLKIKYLCKSIPDVEWSGILFYSIKGSIKKPATMQIILEDILPMDKGSKTYTEYNIDERYMEYIMEDESRMEWKMGHIHSHNTMNVYFSGTDMSELNDNAPSHNFYLSLIVNNYMDFTAKVAFVGSMKEKVKKLNYMALDENGQKYVIEKRDFTIEKEKLYVLGCDIRHNAETITVGQDFADKVRELLKPKVVQPVQTTQQKRNPNTPLLPAPKTNMKDRPGRGDAVKKNGKKNKSLAEMFDEWEADVNLFQKATDSTHEGFCTSVLNFSLGVPDEVGIEDILSSYEDLNMTPQELASSVMHVYVAVYEGYYDDVDDTEMFIERTQIFLENLEEWESVFPIVSDTIDVVREMLTKFEEYGTSV